MASKKNRGKHAPGAQAELNNNAVEQQQVNTDNQGASSNADQMAAVSSGAAQDAASVLVLPDSYKPIDLEAYAARRRRRKIKTFLIILAVILAVLAAVYGGIGLMFSSKFLPNTTIGDFDVSMKSDEEVIEMLDTIPDDYKLEVSKGKFSLSLTGADVNMQIDSKGIVKAMHDDLYPWYWPMQLVEGAHDESHLLETTFDEKTCNELVNEAVQAFNKNAKAPKNAYIVYDDESQSFKIMPGTLGKQLGPKKVQAVVREAIADMQEKLKLTDDQLKQPSVTENSKKIIKSAEIANGIVSAHLKLRINGDVVDEIGSEELSDFVKIDDKFKVSLDEEQLAQWVNNLAASYNTIGMERSYTRADGKQITVRGGSYGWEVDQESLSSQIMEAIQAGKKTKIDVPCIDEANVYAGPGERDWGARYIDVDLSEQHVRFYGDDGNIIWEADCITGAPDEKHATPEGVWYVLMKQSPSTLIGYLENGKKDYETQVKYWMPFQGNSVGFHDATWQPSFGGSMYAQGYGSHGCVNLSYSDAESLYSIIEPNDVVVVHS